MEIIKRGTLPPDNPHECTCPKCGTEFKYNDLDVVSITGERRVLCPVCNYGNMAGATLAQAYYSK